MAEITSGKGNHITGSANVLAYGHFGTATYDTSEQRWYFLRTDDLNTSEEGLGSQPRQHSFELVQSPSTHTFLELTCGALPSEQNHQRLSTNFLLHDLPEVCAANKLVLYKHQTAEPDRFEPTGNTFAFGGALLLGDDDMQSDITLIPILVAVHGLASDKLVFSCLTRQQLSIEDGKTHSKQLDVPQLCYNEVALWTSKRSIKHMAVSSKTSSHRNSRLAALTESGITIFRPQLRRSNTSQPLTANPIMEIPVSSTGDQPLSHATFHPLSSNVIAIVDAKGSWSTWTIRGKASRSARSTQRAHLLIYGCLSDSPHHKTNPSIMAYPTGWHRIYWLGSNGNAIDHILICNREALFLYHMNSRTVQQVDLRPEKGSSDTYVLDLIPSSASNCEFFILTQSHLMWLSLQNSIQDDAARRPILTRVMACRHLRGLADRSLTVHTLEHQEDVWIILCSLATKILTVYRAHRSALHGATISQPEFMVLPFENVRTSCKIMFRIIETEVRVGSSTTPGPLLFKILLQRDDGTIDDATYQTVTTLNANQKLSQTQQISLPSSRIQYHRSARYLSPNDLDDFGTSDDDSVPTILRQQAQSSGVGLSSRMVNDGGQATTICDFGATYDAMLKDITRPSSYNRADMEEYLSAIVAQMTEVENLQPYQLLAELPLKLPYVAEIEEDSQLVSQLVDDIFALAERSSDGHQLPSLGRLDSDDMMTRYERLVHDWVLPLSQNISDRTRIFRERLARQIAFDSHLSTVFVKLHSDDAGEEVVSPHLRAHDLSTMSPTDNTGNDQGMWSSQSHGESNFSRQDTNSKSRSLLMSYVKFRKTLPDPKATDAVADILAHLPTSVHEDPEEYNYSAVELELASIREETLHRSLDSHARRKAERLAKSRKRQLQMQEQAKKVAFDARSQIPLITSSQLPIRNIQSSQAQSPSVAPTDSQSVPQVHMSQPERGQFGDRSNKKGKNKAGRRAGFR